MSVWGVTNQFLWSTAWQKFNVWKWNLSNLSYDFHKHIWMKGLFWSIILLLRYPFPLRSVENSRPLSVAKSSATMKPTTNMNQPFDWFDWLYTCICHTSHAVNCMNKNWGSQIQLSSLKAWDTHVEWWYSKTKSTLPLPKKKTIISFLQANIHGETPHQKPQFAD